MFIHVQEKIFFNILFMVNSSLILFFPKTKFISSSYQSKQLPVVRDLKGRLAYFIKLRNSSITTRFLNSRVVVSGDYKNNSFVIKPDMIGFKFGVFSLTKKTGRFIHSGKDRFRTKKSAAKKKTPVDKKFKSTISERKIVKNRKR